jgi:tetratricopeptide (TPR) repeat protein
MNQVLRTLAVACVAACAALTPTTHAENAERVPAAAEAAQAAYERGIELRRTDPAASLEAFRDSAARWERIRAAGAENGPLEFNLGNAWMESGDVGRAIAAYLRAERFMPGDADLAHNLARARSTVSSSFERTGGTLLVNAPGSLHASSAVTVGTGTGGVVREMF